MLLHGQFATAEEQALMDYLNKSIKLGNINYTALLAQLNETCMSVRDNCANVAHVFQRYVLEEVLPKIDAQGKRNALALIMFSTFYAAPNSFSYSENKVAHVTELVKAFTKKGAHISAEEGQVILTNMQLYTSAGSTKLAVFDVSALLSEIETIFPPKPAVELAPKTLPFPVPTLTAEDRKIIKTLLTDDAAKQYLASLKTEAEQELFVAKLAVALHISNNGDTAWLAKVYKAYPRLAELDADTNKKLGAFVYVFAGAMATMAEHTNAKLVDTFLLALESLGQLDHTDKNHVEWLMVAFTNTAKPKLSAEHQEWARHLWAHYSKARLQPSTAPELPGLG